MLRAPVWDDGQRRHVWRTSRSSRLRHGFFGATWWCGPASIATVLCVLTSPGLALAQQYPRQAVEMTVLFGGSSATVAQILADAMSRELGVPVVAVRDRKSVV